MDYRLLTDALDAAPADRRFITMWRDEDDSSTATFGEFRALAEGHATRLESEGVGPGDRVVLIMPQGIPLMAAFAGAMRIGAVPAILAYPNFKVEPNKYRAGLQGVTRNLSARVVVIDQDFPEEMLGHVATGEGARLVRAIDEPRDPVVRPARCDPDQVAFIQHSAGTTGLQKGVALSHAAVLRQLRHLAASLEITGSDIVYSWLPLYHDMGLIACFLLPMVCHLPVVMQSPTEWVMEPGTMLRLVGEHRATLAWIPNFTLQFLARRVPERDRAGLDLSSMRALVNCSEPVRAQSMDEFLRAFEPRGFRAGALQSSYAMAETVFAVTQSTVGEPPRRLWIDGAAMRDRRRAEPCDSGREGAVCHVSSGTCIDGSRVRVLDAEGGDLAEGEAGELAVSSDSLFDGYFNRPDLSDKVLRGGWYLTGDLGFVLNGEVYVMGRKKDLIIVGGKNIYPQDIEEIACAHPRIQDGRAVALGLFNSDAGTEDIVLVAEARSEEDLAEAPLIERTLKNDVVATMGVAVRHVIIKPPRWIVKSTAGKPARSTTLEKLMREHPELR